MPLAGKEAGLKPWPQHPRLREGEALSSWLVRIADANGVTLRCLCRQLCPEREALREPLDRRPAQDFVEALAARTLTSHDAIHRATIWSLFPAMIIEQAPLFGHQYWVLPLSQFSRQGGGQQFCPDCLAEEDTCHYQMAWRLGFVTACGRHRRLLEDVCPSCGRAKTLVGGTSHVQLPRAMDALTRCLHCGCGFREAAGSGHRFTKAPSILDGHALSMQETLASALEHGTAPLPGLGMGFSNLLFQGVRQVLKLLLADRRKGRIQATVRRILGAAEPILPWGDKHLPSHFELLNIRNRHALMGVAGWLLESWPTRFVEVIREAGVPLKDLVDGGRNDLPFWYLDVVRQHFCVAHAPWRAPGTPLAEKKGSYKLLANRKTSGRLSERERRLDFIREHPDLAGNLKALAKAMRKAGLYSERTQVATITQSLPSLVGAATRRDEWWRCAGTPVSPVDRPSSRSVLAPAAAS